MVRKAASALTAIALLLALAGCTGRTLIVTWTPNPIVVKKGDQTIEGTVTIRTGGTFGNLTIERITVEALDKDGNPVKDPVVIDLNLTLPIFANINESRKVEIKVTYDEVVALGVTEVRITVTGSDPGVERIKVQAE